MGVQHPAGCSQHVAAGGDVPTCQPCMREPCVSSMSCQGLRYQQTPTVGTVESSAMVRVSGTTRLYWVGEHVIGKRPEKDVTRRPETAVLSCAVHWICGGLWVARRARAPDEAKGQAEDQSLEVPGEVESTTCQSRC